MGKGDKKSKKGKRFSHSYGKTRTRKKGLTISSRKKVEVKPKPVEQKKHAKPAPEIKKPIIVESKVEEIAISKPKIVEIKEEVKPTETFKPAVTLIPEITPEPIKEEVKLPEIKEAVVPEVPEIAAEPVIEEPKVEEPVLETLKAEMKEKEKPAQESPKKRGRPKKKKEE